MHATKAYLGTGIFAMGASMRDTGTLLGPILLILMAIINAVCQHILVSNNLMTETYNSEFKDSNEYRSSRYRR